MRLVRALTVDLAPREPRILERLVYACHCHQAAVNALPRPSASTGANLQNHYKSQIT